MKTSALRQSVAGSELSVAADAGVRRWTVAPERGRRRPDGAVAFAPGADLYCAGEAARAVFVLLAGRVRLWNRAGPCAAMMTGLLRPGALFGLDSLSAERYGEGARAETDCVVRVVPVDLVDKLLGSQPGFAAQLLEALVRRRSAAEELLARALTAGVPGRLAGALLDAADGGVVAGQTRQLLADAAWTTRETATRVLYHLAEQGFVRVDGRTIHLIDFDGLRRLAAGSREAPAA
jgi:CRP-like cAMP-binding protein